MKFYLLFAIYVIGLISASAAKGHHGRQHHGHGSATPTTNEGGDQRKALHHEITNRIAVDNERRRDKPQNDTPLQTQKTNASSSPSISRKKVEDKKNLLHRNAQEHNVNKKQLDDQDGIPMEKEFLIHVTPNPPNAKKIKKMQQGQKRRVTTSQPKSPDTPLNTSSKNDKTHKSPSSELGHKSHRTRQRIASSIAARKGSILGTKRASKGSSSKGAKAHRYPKKYNPQKHSWKKNQKKDKIGDKIKEKREKLSEKMRERREKRNKKMKSSYKVTEKKI